MLQAKIHSKISSQATASTVPDSAEKELEAELVRAQELYRERKFDEAQKKVGELHRRFFGELDAGRRALYLDCLTQIILSGGLTISTW
jgi:hypothetical protein